MRSSCYPLRSRQSSSRNQWNTSPRRPAQSTPASQAVESDQSFSLSFVALLVFQTLRNRPLRKGLTEYEIRGPKIYPTTDSNAVTQVTHQCSYPSASSRVDTESNQRHATIRFW